mmetsp:Transcript_48969/g.122724  ORF Transcript_48969/g.122724 Transcript_48969/m.122724 type:complete len:275 (-) Transcript_48969:570-1394(-)
MSQSTPEEGTEQDISFQAVASSPLSTGGMFGLCSLLRPFSPSCRRSSLTGMNLQTTASVAPVTAIHTTDTAGGTRTAKSAKCSLARRKPNADDFMAVSIAMVRAATSPKPIALGMKKPKSPPSRWRRMMGICSLMPASRIGWLTCATDDATSRHVDITPTRGVTGRIALTALLKNLLAIMPTAMGPRTTVMVLLTMPTASSATLVPSRALHRRGVAKMAPMVVAVVISTDSATSPRAMYVHKFDACPPLMHPTNTRPAASVLSSPATVPRSLAR